ncbi:M28 family metallopeptidase [Sphingomonas sp. H39-1-10]|uniref:M28 family metallopeptidase n=1 Tax=Sphingomonas pollutisoli TaxID=3030829 RepID=UPI0023BA036C|nr:M28 family metallopeptidase [Sphingomonas pollutisoli]MDF0487814.1 M28 family metallopeptidase [Sphingomonas pollutisoli]
MGIGVAGRWMAGVALALVAAGVARADNAPQAVAPSPVQLPDDQAAMKAHVMFLASDALRGREAGTPEYRIAAEYVAARFFAAGLRPAGDKGGYLQSVPLLRYQPADHGDLVVTAKGGAPVPLLFGKDFVPGAVPGKPVFALDAPVVFVGQGIVAPKYKRNDYAGVDVRGKIVAFLAETPANFQSEERAHFASPASRTAIAADRGAVGAIMIEPGSVSEARWDRARMTWAYPDGTGQIAGVPLIATVSGAGAAKLFAHARTPWDKIAPRADDPTATFKAEQLPVILTAALKTLSEPLESYNVGGLLPGTDPSLSREVVVLSAHLDHLGVGLPVNGDAIYNGAQDNAVGIAALIEAAKRFRNSDMPTRRSILFLATTAEEEGLVGSDFFARHPPVPASRIVADVNFDMPILSYPFQDMTVFGADRSTLGPIVAQAVAALGVTMSTDPDPGEGFFVRSDHYRFVQQGIPSVFLWPGQAGPGKAAFEDFMKHRYHQPSDDLSQPIDWAQGLRFVAANTAITRAIADAPERPRWTKGDFFGLLYDGPGAK